MLRRMHQATSGVSALLLIGMAGCVELDVQNPNDADAARALRTAGDVEALIGGAYGTFDNVMNTNGPTLFLSNAAGQHAAPWANFGMEEYARIPRVPSNNVAGGTFGNGTYGWYQAYRAISSLRDGLKQMADGTVDLGANTVRAQAYAKLIQGLSHASIAVLYDSGFVYDETSDPDAVPLQGYTAVMTAAMGYFDAAVTLATGASFTTPSAWFGTAVTAADLVRMAHSEKARFYAAMARTPAERRGLDWNLIRTEAQAGFTSDWSQLNCATGSSVCQNNARYFVDEGWAMQNNWVLGMADQNGLYQAWINTPTVNKQPFLIVTPDTRWPRGATESAQALAANNGVYFRLLTGSVRASIWQRPDRGTWRWSYYRNYLQPFFDFRTNGQGSLPAIRATEMRALVAEADFYAGNLPAVATFVNATRTTYGLNATNSTGLNTSCVPKLPNGTCGDLWEMFKWEKRLETLFASVLRVGFYFDARGWGDLMEGSMLQLPVPFGEMQLFERSPYNFGGVGGTFGAPVGTYGY